MKHNRNYDDAPVHRTPDPQLVPVHFEFKDPKATTVCLAGTFNHWQPDSKTLDSSGVGHWWKDTALEPGAYEYCFVVDGNWIADPLAKETVPNPFGGRNSLLRVACSPEAAHLADAENLPLKNEYNE
jgi:1,4-alpha-glucan branching enzyme